jgi:hypothetical protein
MDEEKKYTSPQHQKKKSIMNPETSRVGRVVGGFGEDE